MPSMPLSTIAGCLGSYELKQRAAQTTSGCRTRAPFQTHHIPVSPFSLVRGAEANRGRVRYIVQTVATECKPWEMQHRNSKRQWKHVD